MHYLRPHRHQCSRSLLLLTVAAVLLFVTNAAAQPNSASSPPSVEEVELEAIMAHPNWIGYWPKDAAFAPSGRSALYLRSRKGVDDQGRPLRGDEVVEIDLDGRELATNPVTALPKSVDRRGSEAVYLWQGDLYRESEQRSRLTRGAAEHEGVRWLDDRSYLIAEGKDRLWKVDAATGARRLVARVLVEEDPRQPKEGFVPELQDRLFPVLAEREEATRRAKETEGVPTVYLGADREVVKVEADPNLRYLTVVDRAKPSRNRDRMPVYLTRDGKTDSRELRSKVGAEEPVQTRVSIYDLWTDGAVRELDLVRLPGLSDERPFRLESWSASPAGSPHRLAMWLLTEDFKDRYLVLVEPDKGEYRLLHHYSDPGWQAWDIAELGWTPDGRALWFQSEETGYAHLYLWEGGQSKALTSGAFEVRDIVSSPDGSSFYFRANRENPGRYDVYRVSRQGRTERITSLGGGSEFDLSPDGRTLLLRHSKTAQPPELYLQEARPGAQPRRLTHTVSPEFAAVDWTLPRFVEVPSSHHSRGVPSKLYLPPAGVTPNGAGVVFIHGAGYLQNADEGWSNYFREFMFHTLLTRMGVAVLDMDYRASMGYGRDWRTAIARQMGTPELEDLKDGVSFLVQEAAVDPERVGVYGGSYGGFMTLMALFKEPDLFACGAALRSVTDWSQYNHEYTGRILNTPQDDPESYLRSSPIEFAEGLTKPLLMTHGILDDNVVAQDTIRLAQRLIDLEKEDWEMALYPVEPHGFIEPSSWLDQYRRILKLFRLHLQLP